MALLVLSRLAYSFTLLPSPKDTLQARAMEDKTCLFTACISWGCFVFFFLYFFGGWSAEACSDRSGVIKYMEQHADRGEGQHSQEWVFSRVSCGSWLRAERVVGGLEQLLVRRDGGDTIRPAHWEDSREAGVSKPVRVGAPRHLPVWGSCATLPAIGDVKCLPVGEIKYSSN